MPDLGKLVSGFRIFKATIYPQKKDLIGHLVAQGQKPSTMVIACSDLRLSPAEIFSTNPGELYVVGNVGGLVPKFATSGVHGVLAAIEHAVINLEVENIVVLGHARCNSIKIMMSDEFAKKEGLSEAMKTWLSIASEAREVVKKELHNKPKEEQQSACEYESIIISMRNLIGYPYIAERMAANKLNIFGWHFDIQTGEIMAFNPDTGFFDPIS